MGEINEYEQMIEGKVMKILPILDRVSYQDIEAIAKIILERTKLYPISLIQQD